MKLHVTDLTVARGGRAILSGINFGLEAGQGLILRGPNGIGKTTLLRTIAGLQPAISGHIRPDPDHIAYASHADAVKGALTVAENLHFWAKIYGTPSMEPALDHMQLQPLRDRPGQNLSAGQKRRLGLARLLLSNRKIWILDEPTVSLDLASAGLFRLVLGRHLQQGGIALMVTHIDLGLPDIATLDLTSYGALQQVSKPLGPSGFDEAFL
ncbi:MAG: heme ABC exporter ATP-binding protein CcmA [Rhodobacteraceae bacterium]|nr:heme ABC exporter ATP-binding protein CcmA [Paracoccaceae bacterium]